MITYYGSKISDNMTKTPEGYLICHNVPIARTGQQIYLGRETPYTDLPPNKEITVVRLPEEVFSRETMASFEGKPVTDNHPAEDVLAENSRYYLKGIARDVRRGAGQFNDCIVADLMIYDPVLIDEILNKSKREISCGYDCFWEQGNGDTMIQRKIRGNHIAVVENGRAGHKVAVRDNKPSNPKYGGNKRMSAKNLKNKILAMFAKDEGTTPEEIAQASKILGDTEPETLPKEDTTNDEPPINEILTTLKAIGEAVQKNTETLAAIVQAEKREDAHKNDEISTLDELENELEGNPGKDESISEQEKSVTVPAETIDEDKINSLVNKPACDEALANLKVLKPIVAGIQDKVVRKKAIDSLAKLVRGNVQDRQYANVLKAARNTNDSNVVNERDLGRIWAKKFNPQYKEDK